jgi:hypothetical protein
MDLTRSCPIDLCTGIHGRFPGFPRGKEACACAGVPAARVDYHQFRASQPANCCVFITNLFTINELNLICSTRVIDKDGIQDWSIGAASRSQQCGVQWKTCPYPDESGRTKQRTTPC